MSRELNISTQSSRASSGTIYTRQRTSAQRETPLLLLWRRSDGQEQIVSSSIAHRIRYVHGFLLSKLWYTAHVLPVVRPHTQQLSTAITWYIWRGAVFRVPVSTLQKPKKEGGWGLLDLEAQCRALLLCRMYVQSKKEGTMTAAWMESWGLVEGQPNPPNANRTLKQFVYL